MLSYQSLMPAAAAHQGMKMRPGRWRSLGVMGATPPLWIPAFAGMPRWQQALLRLRSIIFVPIDIEHR